MPFSFKPTKKIIYAAFKKHQSKVGSGS